jgi:hypothetical protein
MSCAPIQAASPARKAFPLCQKFLIGILALFLFHCPPILSKEKVKQDKFHGVVVKTGPKAISVKSEDNIYLIRTFNYTPQLEEKLKKKSPQPGKKVTVIYVRGSDLATKIK